MDSRYSQDKVGWCMNKTYLSPMQPPVADLVPNLQRLQNILCPMFITEIVKFRLTHTLKRLEELFCCFMLRLVKHVKQKTINSALMKITKQISI